MCACERNWECKLNGTSYEWGRDGDLVCTEEHIIKRGTLVEANTNFIKYKEN